MPYRFVRWILQFTQFHSLKKKNPNSIFYAAQNFSHNFFHKCSEGRVLVSLVQYKCHRAPEDRDVFSLCRWGELWELSDVNVADDTVSKLRLLFLRLGRTSGDPPWPQAQDRLRTAEDSFRRAAWSSFLVVCYGSRTALVGGRQREPHHRCPRPCRSRRGWQGGTGCSRGLT